MKTIKYAIFIGLLLLTALVYADPQDNQDNVDNWYQINVIVFEHITPQALNSELWPTITNSPNIGQAVEPELLDQDASQLKTEAHNLNRRSNYKVLLNIAWQQQIPVTDHALPTHIFGGQSYDDGAYQINGVIAINRTRYFGISANLILTEPTSYLNMLGVANYATENNGSFKSFQMRQILRLRSKELGYMSHPLFGVLIKIMPMIPLAMN